MTFKSEMKSKSELEFEQEVIQYLTNIGGVKQWEYKPKIKTTQDLWDNFKQIVERNNHARLEHELSINEFNQVKKAISNLQTPYQAGQFLYGVNGVSEVEVDLDDGRHVFLTIFDQAQVGGGSTVYQIVNQIHRDKIIDGKKDRIFDVTMLINGLPILQLELKKCFHDSKEAFNQMKQYIDERQYSGIFSTLQILVAMTPNDIKYMANTTIEQFNTEFSFSWQDEETAKPVYNWKTFADKVLSIPMAHDLSTRYMVLDGTKNKEGIKVMRPYQVYATKKALDKVKKHDFNFGDGKLGYIWHTTGSGKTITSFKTAWLASRMPNVDKVVFLVDRVALTNQTADAYKAYDPIAGFEGKTGVISETANVSDLQRQLTRKSDKNIIVTSIQKMARYVKRESFKKLDKNILFIVDEAHRSMGDGSENEGMLTSIREALPKSAWIGYTGTPKFPETEKIFGESLHRYTIKEAIADHNVLGFKVEFHETIPVKGEHSEEEIDDNLRSSIYDESDEHLRRVVEDILKNWETRSNNRKYNALFTVHVGGGKPSIPRALEYYREFAKQNAERPEEKRIKVGISFAADTSNSDRQFDTNKGLEKAMSDYSNMFGEKFGLDNVKGYLDNITRRLNKTVDDGNYLDLVIVVDQLLTGFDAPQLNTLYIDRTLKDGNLIQAYSRTNRLHNRDDKPHGNIVNYRWPVENELQMNRAFAIYSNRNSADIQLDLPLEDYKEMNRDADIIAEEYKEVETKVLDVLAKLSELTDEFTDTPHSERDKETTFELLKQYNSLMSKLKQYPTDSDGKPVSAYDNPEEFYRRIGITEDQEMVLTTVIANQIKRDIAENKKIDVSQIELTMVQVQEITINYDYLIDLIARLANEIKDDLLQNAKETYKDIQIEIEKSESENFRDETKQFVDAVFNKEYEFEEYPVDGNNEVVTKAMESYKSTTNLKKASDFVHKWGLSEQIKASELLKMLEHHKHGEDDLDKRNEITDLMNAVRNEYQELATEEVRAMRWIIFRGAFREAIQSLADEIKRYEK